MSFDRLVDAYHKTITWDNWKAIADLNDLVFDDGTLTDEQRQQTNVIPQPPIIGTLDPDDVLQSRYMFC